MAFPVRRLLCAALSMGGLFASPLAVADTWGDLIVTSPTLPITTGYLCQGAGSIEVGCPTTAPYLTSAGLLGIGTATPTTAVEVSGTVSATTLSTDNLLAGGLTISGDSSMANISASANVSVTGNVSANKFIGDGSGLTGIGSASGDRITSGTTSVIVYTSNGYVSLTQAGTNTAYFHPSLGLVAVGVSSTGGISGTTGYFSGNVGIGTSSPNTALVVSANNTSGWNQAITLNSYDNGTGMVGGGLRLASMRGTAATPTNTLYGDQIGSVNFSGYWTGKANAYFGQNESRVSIIARASEDWNSSANTGTFLTFNTTGNGSGSSYERMRIDASGNIGIGTKAPAVPLDVSGAIKVAGDGAESCTAATVGVIRRNPVTGRLEACH